MRENQRNPKRATLTILDAVVTIAVLVLSLQVIDLLSVFVGLDGNEFLDHYNYSGDYLGAAGLYFALAAAELIRFFAQRGGTKLNSIRHLLGTALFFVSSVLLLAKQGDFFSCMFAGVCFGVTCALGRVDAMRRDRRARSIVTNAVALLLIIVLLVSLIGLILIPIFLVVYSMIHVAAVALSQINLRALQKVLRKTYAVEVIFGLLLLIVAFSVMLQNSEEGIETFADGLWYCFAIVTTIGFGDITATGVMGRILSVILGIYGIIVVSLITSVIVNFYNEVKDAPDSAPPPLPTQTPEPESKEEEAP